MNQTVSTQKVSLKSDLPDIYGFLDFRDYLKAFYQAKKRMSNTYSHRVFSRKAQCSASYFQMILKGERKLHPSKISAFARACGLKPSEETYFLTLVQWNQATVEELRAQYWQRLVKLAPKDDIHFIQGIEEYIISRWYILPLIEMIQMKNFNSDPTVIASRFNFQVKAIEIQEALEMLEKIGAVRLQDGTVTLLRPTIIANPEFISGEAIRAYHKTTIPMGAEAVETVSKDQRHIVAGTFAIPMSKIHVMKEKIQEFRDEMLEIMKSAPDSDAVYQLNVQFFPVIGPVVSSQDMNGSHSSPAERKTNA